MTARATPPSSGAVPGRRLRALVVDDEPLARARLCELLGDEADIDVVAECGNGADAVDAITRDRPDLVLLDIQMPELDGFGVVRSVGVDRMPAVVFVTAHDEHAVAAFEVHAVDYVLKPVDRERFAEALRRARHRIAAAENVLGQDEDRDIRERLAALVAEVSAAVASGAAGAAGVAAPGPARGGLARLAVKGDGRVVFVRTADVDWIEAMDNYVRLHVARETHVMRETLSHLETRLPAGTFLRIHRSTIVNVERIREVQPWFGGDYVVILIDGTKLTTGRRYRAAVQTLLDRSL
jgi:two-component system LytT family response regulator